MLYMRMNGNLNSNGPSFTGRVLSELLKGGGGCLSFIMSSIGIFIAVVLIVHKAFLGIWKFL